MDVMQFKELVEHELPPQLEGIADLRFLFQRFAHHIGCEDERDRRFPAPESDVIGAHNIIRGAELWIRQPPEVEGESLIEEVHLYALLYVEYRGAAQAKHVILLVDAPVRLDVEVPPEIHPEIPGEVGDGFIVDVSDGVPMKGGRQWFNSHNQL